MYSMDVEILKATEWISHHIFIQDTPEYHGDYNIPHHRYFKSHQSCFKGDLMTSTASPQSCSTIQNKQ